jgi:hypothetical protein
MCPDFSSLYELEDDFNKVGMTIRPTASKRMVVCVVENNRPKTGKIFEDYMFVGQVNKQNEELSSRFVECLLKFIRKSASAPVKVENPDRTWEQGAMPYGKAVGIAMEDVDYKMQIIAESRTKTNDLMLG